MTPSLAEHSESYPDAVFGLSSGFFHLPAALAREWGVDEDAVLTELQVVGALGHFHFAFQDLVFDEREAPAVMCLLSDTCLLAYLDGLQALVPDRGPHYRELHRRYYDRYAAATLGDLAHREHLTPYGADELLRLGDKAAPGVTMLHVVADLAGRTEGVEAVAAALLRLCTGLQLMDDLADCVQDAVTGNRTWPVTSALLAYPELDVSDAEAVEAAVLGSGAAHGCARLAVEAFRDAARQAVDAGGGVLAELAETWRARAVRRVAGLDAAFVAAGRAP
ncbi:hypothetical protein ACRYCC_35060 [Actinomadura scrupuli]